MDSINAQQQEKNHEDVIGPIAVDKIREIVDAAQTCFFCTATPTGESSAARPMNVRQVDDEGNLWFLSASDSHKNAEIEIDPMVRLFMQGSAHAEFMTLIGHATISRDKAKIEELWNPYIRTWFTGGKDDPRITVIKVVPTDGYYWDNKHGTAVAGVKMMIGAMLRRTMDDSIEGSVIV